MQAQSSARITADSGRPRTSDTTIVIRVSADRALDAAEPEQPHTESHLAVNPRDGRHMVAIAMKPVSATASPRSCLAYGVELLGTAAY